MQNALEEHTKNSRPAENAPICAASASRTASACPVQFPSCYLRAIVSGSALSATSNPTAAPATSALKAAAAAWPLTPALPVERGSCLVRVTVVYKAARKATTPSKEYAPSANRLAPSVAASVPASAASTTTLSTPQENASSADWASTSTPLLEPAKTVPRTALDAYLQLCAWTAPAGWCLLPASLGAKPPAAKGTSTSRGAAKSVAQGAVLATTAKAALAASLPTPSPSSSRFVWLLAAHQSIYRQKAPAKAAALPAEAALLLVYALPATLPSSCSTRAVPLSAHLAPS